MGKDVIVTELNKDDIKVFYLHLEIWSILSFQKKNDSAP
jgi:hypothetical protein